MKKTGPKGRRAKVPLSWRVVSILSMIPLGVLIFYLIFRASGGKYPLAAGDSTDPYAFGFIFAVLIPVAFYSLIVDRVMRGIVSRRAGRDIAMDVAKDVAEATALAVVDAVLGGSSGGDRSSSSSGSGTKGGGGDFGGGGASGGY